MPLIIRDETPSDIPITRLIEIAAFGRSTEAGLVDGLRADHDLVFSLVAADDDAIIGHAMFSKMNAPFRALGLGPVAVLPHRQRTGVGTRLIREGLAKASAEGWQAVFVVGAPAFYQRFGFDVSKTTGFRSPHAGPHFMALALGSDDLPTRTGSVNYPRAFAKVARD